MEDLVDFQCHKSGKNVCRLTPVPERVIIRPVAPEYLPGLDGLKHRQALFCARGNFAPGILVKQRAQSLFGVFNLGQLNLRIGHVKHGFCRFGVVGELLYQFCCVAIAAL